MEARKRDKKTGAPRTVIELLWRLTDDSGRTLRFVLLVMPFCMVAGVICLSGYGAAVGITSGVSSAVSGAIVFRALRQARHLSAPNAGADARSDQPLKAPDHCRPEEV